MLKIAVFDTGYGGEIFADRLETELPVVEVIRVIAWRDAERIEKHPLTSRKIVEESLRSYIGNVDLIVVANYQLSATCLSYLRRKYKNQKFIGFTLRPKRIVKKRPTVILTTKPTTKSLAYRAIAHELKAKTICLDHWPTLIDDGELTDEHFKADLEPSLNRIAKSSHAFRHTEHFTPTQVLLACGQFTECTPKFRKIFGHNTRIVDSFDHTLNEAIHTLKLRKGN